MNDFGKLIDNASKGMVNNWEKGVNLPNKNRLKLIADFANISVEELLNDDVRVISLPDELTRAVENGDANTIFMIFGDLKDQIAELQQEIQSLKENKNEK